MDISGSGAATALNAPVTTTASGLPAAANFSLRSGVNGQQGTEAIDLTHSAPGEQQTAFNDALLSVINGLLQGQGKEINPLIVSGMPAEESEEKKGEGRGTALTEPQQMLDSLLQASQQQIAAVPVSSTPLQTADALLTNHRSGAHGGIAPLAIALQTSSAQPNGEQSVQPPLPVSLKGMQSVAPQPLMTTLSEGAAPVSPLASGQSAAAPDNDKAVSFQTRLALIKPEGGEDRLAWQLHAALGERLQVQVKNQIQHATIRLDPPDMGKIDISMQIENGRMQVHINASQGEVYRALQQVSNDLRQSLTEQNFVQVNVQVSSQSGQPQGGKEHQFAGTQTNVLAAAEADSDSPGTDRREDDSVILTV